VQSIEPKAWWRDYTGRFTKRPYYENAAIESAALVFVESLLGASTWPLDDDQLDTLADLSTASFDRARDMSSLGFEADAVTIFSRTNLPKLILSDTLVPPNMRNRRRMTIAHELGHIVLHQPLYTGDQRQLDLLQEYRTIPAYCHDAMSKTSVDWCEWQASYFGGALLAPHMRIRAALESASRSTNPERDGSVEARAMTAIVARDFVISKDAARVRLAQVGFIIPTHVGVLSVSDTA
jgi:Zn-dependent peptidase ImmA (M78 family)